MVVAGLVGQDVLEGALGPLRWDRDRLRSGAVPVDAPSTYDTAGANLRVAPPTSTVFAAVGVGFVATGSASAPSVGDYVYTGLVPHVSFGVALPAPGIARVGRRSNGPS